MQPKLCMLHDKPKEMVPLGLYTEQFLIGWYCLYCSRFLPEVKNVERLKTQPDRRRYLLER